MSAHPNVISSVSSTLYYTFDKQGKMLDYGSHFLDLVACLIMEGKDLKIEKIGGLMVGLATTGSLIGAEDKVIMSVF